MSPLFRALALFLLVLVLPALAMRPLLPVDETRYLSVAWEMFRDGDWLVPHLNGEPYSHKPPLLFWLVNLLWSFAGPLEWVARLVAPAFGLVALALTATLARRLWPGEDGGWTAATAPLILVGTLLWAVFATLTMFDTMLAVFALVAAHGLLDLQDARWRRGLLLFALATGFGALAKGPVILVHVLAAALAARIALGGAPRRQWSWLGLLALGLLLGAALALLWAVPAARQGGPAYAEAIFLEQSAGRIVESFAHRRPAWWYLALLPAITLPWCLLPGLWRRLPGALRRPDMGLRFCLLWFLTGLVAFSLVSGKQVHYLLPLLPPLALALARILMPGLPAAASGERAVAILLPAAAAASFIGLGLLDLAGALPGGLGGLPDWVRAAALPVGAAAAILAALAAFLPRGPLAPALGCAGLVAAIHLAAGPHARPYYDLTPIATHVADLQAEGRPVAFLGRYQGQLDFLGRLQRPLTVLRPAEARGWAEAHPAGAVLMVWRRDRPAPVPPAFLQPYRNRLIGQWDAAEVATLLPAGP
ncbi:MAG: glycosyltransferase family 39 protein [Alphaproteobacteria bacterium]|nr:glycosyltransferase family 39 protein [Alphaproteobacteria bacterium]